MADVRIEHVLSCSEDAFWTTLFDPKFNEELYLKVLKFESWKVVSMEDKAGKLERVVDAVPNLADLPGPLKKLVEGGAGYRERVVFDKAAKRMTTVAEPASMQGKLSISGVMYTQAMGESSVRRIVDQTVVAKIFGVGGMIENRIIGDLKASYDKAATFTNEWAKRT
jgi:hypothetical protein